MRGRGVRTPRPHCAGLFYRSAGKTGVTGGAEIAQGASVPAPDEIPELRVDVLAELAPAEDAVVAHALRQQMPALLGRDVLAQDMCGFGLTVAGNVVELAFDREQRAGLDRFRAHQLATYAHPPLR